MNVEPKRLWTAALRSGNYDQGTASMEHRGRLCCLGVLCRVAIAAGVEVRTEEHNGTMRFDDNISCLPMAVREWAGVGGDPRIGIYGAIKLNDGIGLTFDQIADLIDATDPY